MAHLETPPVKELLQSDPEQFVQTRVGLGEYWMVRPKIRVLVADDHQIVREGLVSLLQDEPDMEVVGQASDGQEAVELAARIRPDVVLMDVTMPRLDGVEATRRITHQVPGIRVIGLSMHAKEDIAEAMRAAGAVAYIAKSRCSETLIDTIRDNER